MGLALALGWLGVSVGVCVSVSVGVGACVAGFTTVILKLIQPQKSVIDVVRAGQFVQSRFGFITSAKTEVESLNYDLRDRRVQIRRNP